MKYLTCVFLAFAFSISIARAEPKTFVVTITGGKEDLTNSLVTVTVPDGFKGDVMLRGSGRTIRGQTSPARLLSTSKSPELLVIFPKIKAGETIELTAQNVFTGYKKDRQPEWQIVDGMEQYRTDNRPVIRYFHQPFDPSLSAKGKEIANPTTKPYHHLFASDGKTIVTNSNEGQYPHHRGIFYGFNNISYDGKKADVWHCRDGEYTEHEKVLASVAGPLFGRHTLQIGWHGLDGKIFANEKRELTIYNLPGGTLIDFASILTTPLDKVRLDGDPQHAGFHFRANSAMEKNTKETFFIRPDGKGKPGDEKNWDPATKKGPVNLPWDAMSFVLDGNRYTVVYIDHPNNPKEARQSERCYGRIGTYFEYDLTKDKPLKVRYRLWFQDGEPTVEQCEALSKAFTVAPAKIAVR